MPGRLEDDNTKAFWIEHQDVYEQCVKAPMVALLAELESRYGVTKLTEADIEVTAHETLKTAPRGYSVDHARIELLRMKGCIAWQQWDVGAWLDTSEPKVRVVAFLDASKPLVRWLDSNVGPTELVDARWG